MPEPTFTSMEAQIVARDLQTGHSDQAANRLREDCANLAPRDFANLLCVAKQDAGPNALSAMALYENGQVVVRSQDGRQAPAGQLPQYEVARLLPPPPPPVECPPPAVQVFVPGPRPEYCPPPAQVYVPAERVYAQPAPPVPNTIIGGVVGAGVGILADHKHPGQGALIGGLLGIGTGAIIDNSQR